MNEKISVIIPAYNRAKVIGITVNSLINQTLPKDKYEIIVVDNNSTDNTKQEIEKIIQANKNGAEVRYFLEKNQGVHFARNRGAKEAKNDILYFTDDDMLAEPDALQELLKVFSIDPGVGVVGGVILLKFETEPPKWIKEHCSNSILGFRPKDNIDLIISSKDIGVFSGHQAVRKEVLFKAGGFNPENTKGEWIGDGETGLNKKIMELNYKFAFTAKSVTYHLIPKERLNQKAINKRLANQGSAESYAYYRKHKPQKIGLYFQILKHFLGGLKFFALAVIFFVVGNSQWHLRWAWIFYWKARIKYDIRLLNDKEWQNLVLKSDWINS